MTSSYFLTRNKSISAATVSTPFDNIWFVETPGVNLRHVQLEPDMVQFIFANAISSPLAAQQQTIASGQTLNYGAKTDWVTKKTVEANGVLAVNIPGTTVDGTVANQSEFRAYLTDACTAPKNVEIQENGLLRLGSAAANKKGHLVVTDGTNVRLKSSGKLLIENGSSLTVNLGGSLTIDAGAIIDLPSQNSKIIIRGELIVNGEFNFTGQGCFQFEQGNTITLGNGNTTFKLVGQSRANRFIRIEQSAELALKAGENIELKNGTIEAIGRIELPDANSANFTNLIFDGMDYDEIIHAVSPTSFRMDQSVVKNCFECIGIENVKSTNFRNTDFENYYGRAVWMTNSNAGGANFYNVKFDAAPNLISNAVDADGVRLLNFKDCQFKNNLSGQTGNDPATKSSAIKLANAHWCILKNSKIKDSDIGISNLDAEKPSQIYLYECAEIKNCQWGIFSNGQNFDGGPLPPTGNVGMVLMDGAKLLGNKTGIEGSNILLQLEASVGEGCGSNNEFIKPYHPAPTFYKYFVICYDGNPGSLSMLFNYWGEYVPCAVAYGCINEITTPTDHMNIRQSFCSSVVPVDAVFQMPLEFSHCGPNIDCWYELSGGVQDRNPEEEKGYGSCTFGLETTEVETVESRFRQAYFEFLSENYEAAEALFQPLADLAYSEGFQESSDCRSLVRIARAMTDHGEGVGSRNFKMAIAPTSGFSIQPNPAQDFIEIKGVLPEPFEYRIMHSLGKTVKKGAQLDSKIRLEGIDAGFFWIEIEQAGVLKSLPLFIVR